MATNKLQYTLQENAIRTSVGTDELLCLLVIAGLSFKSLRCSTDVIGVVLITAFLNCGAVYRTIIERVPPDTCLYAAGSVIIQLTLAIGKSRIPLDESIDTKIDVENKSFLKPNLFPCRTTHTRIFPTKHSFSYSYLMVGVPVDWNGSDSMLSTDSAAIRNAWFTVHSDDYLARGHHDGGLTGKLRAYLTSQSVSPAQYKSAYLVTAPRFLGFSFNPISFWYLYDQSNQLSAMILEVNNTFDERRMYFLKRPVELKPGNTFISEWEKDFHVSPFNDRDGSYSVTVRNLLHTTGEVMVDNNIVLRSSESKAKIVARVYSIESGIETTSMTMIERLTFVVKWWWVGFMTNPRILREARTLWIKKLQVFYRPEVYTTSIGRSESTEEAMLEDLFRRLLRFLADDSKNTEISYITAAGPDKGNLVIIKSNTPPTPGNCEHLLSVKVLTPAFYAETVRAQSLLETFEKFCFRAGPGEAMVITSEAATLQTILRGATWLRLSVPQSWKEVFVTRLRRQGLLSIMMSYMYPSQDTDFELSQLDVLVKSHRSATTYQDYLSTTLRILLADRLAFGLMPLLKTYIKIARLVLWLAAALAISSIYSLLR